MDRDRSRVTIHDVAREAGVSIATVSRVLSGSAGAGEHVRARVLGIAQQLGYRGDSVARSLRSRKSNMLGLLVPNITNPFFPALIQSVELELQARQDGLLLADAQSTVSVETDRVRSMLDRRIDALLISPTDEELSQAIIDEALSQIPVVQLDRRAGSAAPYVGVDNAGAIKDAVAHLAAQGRSRFAFVGYSRGVSTSEARVDAFVKYTESIDPDSVTRILREEIGDGEVVPAGWLDQILGDVDAIITSSDLIAVSLRDSLLDRGLRVPEDVALVSFDNTLLAAAANLTSIQQPLVDVARAGIALVSGLEVEVPIEGFPTTLVVRKSSSVRV